jgi:SAM-dependent methyltransferase
MKNNLIADELSSKSKAELDPAAQVSNTVYDSHNARNGNICNTANEFFDQQWQVYNKILHENYMEHREIYGIFDDFITHNYHQPFNMLDLGCGDASFSAPTLLKTPVRSYWGIDLSETALHIARGHLEQVSGEKVLIQGNLLEEVLRLTQNPREEDDKFDIILASFSVHHLSLEQKENLIACLPTLLKKTGVFILIDVIRLPGQDRETYLQRYLNHVRQYWSSFTDQDFLSFKEHICFQDFPETEETLYNLAEKYQFAPVKCLYQDSLNTSRFLCWYQSQES